MTVGRVILQPRRARPFYGRHPWVFAGAVAAVEGDPPDGAEVDLVSHTGNFVARGFFNSQSKIRVRLYAWSPEMALDRAFSTSAWRVPSICAAGSWASTGPARPADSSLARATVCPD